MRVLIVHSPVGETANPDEQDTLVQVEAISASLRELGLVPSTLPCTLDLGATLKSLEKDRPDVIFNLMETIDGVGRFIHLVPSVIAHLGIPMTGCPTEAIALTSSKLLGKAFMRLGGLPVPDWVTPGELGPGRPVPPGKLIIKSVWEHASIGLDDTSILEPRDAQDLLEAMEKRRGCLGGSLFAEAFIPGREFNLSVLELPSGPTVLPPAEIVFERFPDDKPRLVGYKAKWDNDSFEYLHTQRSFDFGPQDGALLERLKALSLRCFSLFNLSGYARVDFRVDEKNRPYILEVNANPCLSPDAGFAAAAGRAGLTYPQIIEALLSAARKSRAQEFALDPAFAPKPLLLAEGEGFKGRGLTFRAALRADDPAAIEAMVRDTGFFSADEVGIAVELVEENRKKGATESGYHFLILEQAGQPIGYSCFGPIPGTAASHDLYWIVVDPTRQGQGLGRQILRETEQRIQALGGAQVYIETSARPQYRPTRAFYEANGYLQEALLKDFYAPGDSKLIYARRIG